MKLLSGLINISTCLVAVTTVLYRQDWFGKGDTYAFVFWTIPLAVGLSVYRNPGITAGDRKFNWEQYCLEKISCRRHRGNFILHSPDWCVWHRKGAYLEAGCPEWRAAEYILRFLLAIWIPLQPMNNAKQ